MAFPLEPVRLEGFSGQCKCAARFHHPRQRMAITHTTWGRITFVSNNAHSVPGIT